MFITKLVKLARIAKNRGFRRGLRHSVAAAVEHEGALRSITIRTLVDVGANVGQFSLLTRTLFPNVYIHAFEPLVAPALRFKKLFLSEPGVFLYPFAASNKNSLLQMHISRREDSSSLLPISALQSQMFPGTEEAGVLEVKAVRLDDVLFETDLVQPLLIKLDIQGYELVALEGMPELLSRAQFVYLEISFLDLYEGQPVAFQIIDWLRARCFTISGIYNIIFDRNGAAVQADAMFRKIID